MIPALILTAGLATRLRPLSLVRAKAALPVAGVPLACRILQWLAGSGVTDAVLNLHHLPDSLTSVVGDGLDLGVRVRYSWEVPVLGSAGGPRRAAPLLGPSFLIVNGDTLTDVDIAAVVADHRRSGAVVTMAAIPNTEPDKYSGLAVTPDGAVTGVVKRGSTQPSFHFIGVQVAQASAFDGAPPDRPYESLGALYPSLIKANPGSIRAFVCAAGFHDIGTPADYLDTSLAIAARDGHRLEPGARSQIDPSARVEGSILWDDVVVEAGAMLRDCIVTDGVRVPADTSWHGVTLRVARGELAPQERRINGLAVSSL